MALSKTSLRTVLGKLIDASPGKITVTISGTDYDAARQVISREKQYEEYGTSSEYRFSVLLNGADLTTIPAVDTTVTISGTTYRIIGIENDSADIGIRLDLGEQYA